MSTKDEVLKLLEENRKQAISGQDMAEILGVSRAAVWKGIKSLEEQGHKIKATTNKGYLLEEDSDVLSVSGISHFLAGSGVAPNLLIYDSVDSTNTVAKKMAMDGGAQGTVIIANQQTAGRGRMGRDFYSPRDTGIYMSFLFRPETGVEDTLKITLGTGVALCYALEKVCDKEIKIKWVNDIFIDGRKVCGILTEAVADFESGTIDSVIIGIGINVQTQNFPGELKEIAGSVFPSHITRNEIAAYVIAEVFAVSENLSSAAFLSEYKERCFLLGQKITYTEKEKTIKAKALDINDKGHLMVEREGGEIVALQWGEVRTAAL